MKHTKEFVEGTETLTEHYLNQADVSIAVAENRLLRHTGDNREAAEIALSDLTLCLISVFIKAVNAAYLSGLAYGQVSSLRTKRAGQVRVEPSQLDKLLKQYQSSQED